MVSNLTVTKHCDKGFAQNSADVITQRYKRYKITLCLVIASATLPFNPEPQLLGSCLDTSAWLSVTRNAIPTAKAFCDWWKFLLFKNILGLVAVSLDSWHGRVQRFSNFYFLEILLVLVNPMPHF